jgi:hypothetical protein
MANEIVELRRAVIGKHSGGGDRLAFDVLFLYPVVPRVVDHNGVQRALTPGANLPPEVAAYQMISQDEIAAMTAGDLAFHVERGIKQNDGEGLAELLARVRRVYVKRGRFVANASAAYENAGQRYNAA